MLAAMTARESLSATTSRAWLLLALLAFVLGACTPKDPPAEEQAITEPASAPLALDLWAGVPPLDPAAADLVGELVPEPGPQLPEQVGEEIELPFPPPPPEAPAGGPSEVLTGPLEVLRFGPSGEVGLVEAIRVSFNHPMVPLASIEDLRAHAVPMQIEPAVEGEFRWLGTRTVALYPAGRLPFSTTYTVTIPAGTTSTHGTALAKDEQWTVTTPALAYAGTAPYAGADHVALDEPLILRFNQPVDADAVAAAIRLRAGGENVALEQVPSSEWESPALEPTLRRWIATGSDEADKKWQRARVVVLRSTAELKANKRYTLALPRGVYGEGPNASKALDFSFTTYPPLKLSVDKCEGPCSASSGIHLLASNQLRDARVIDKVQVSPEVEGLEIHSSWGGISLSGDFVGDTTYTVTVDAGLEDIYGQTLARPFKASVRLGPLYRSLQIWPQTKHPGIIEADAAHTLDLKVEGLRTLEIMASSFSSEELTEFYRYSGRGGDDYAWPENLAKPAHTKVYKVGASRQRTQTLTLDLDDYLEEGDSFVYFIARSESYTSYGWTERELLGQIIQVTDLGLTVAADRDNAEVLVSDLSTGAPISGAELRLIDYSSGQQLWTGTSDTAGLAHPSYGGKRFHYPVLIATHEGREAILPLDREDLEGRWQGSMFSGSPEPTIRSFMFTERTPYKPGETVHLVGMLRKETRGPEGGVELWGQNITATYEVTSPRGVEVQKGSIEVSALGTFSVDIETDPNGDTGNYHFRLERKSLLGKDRSFHHSFPVEAFRAPEFEVEVARATSTPLYFGDELAVELRGRYLFGGAMVGANLSYALRRAPTDFRPPAPGLEDFHFSSQAPPRWRGWGYGGGYSPSEQIDAGSVVLDDRGLFELRHALAQVEPKDPNTSPAPTPAPAGEDDKTPSPRAATFTVDATVTDANRQAISASGSFVVHPSAYYIGLRSERSVLRANEQTRVEVAVVDVTGERIEGVEVSLRAVRKHTTRTPVQRDGVWTFDYATEELETSACSLSSARAPVACDVRVGAAGTHELIAELVDAEGRVNRSMIQLYVHGEEAVIWDEGSKRVDLVADKASYEPGERAKILVRSPFDEARGFVVVEREGMAQTHPVHVQGGAAVIEIGITPAMVAGVTLSAVLTKGRTTVAGAPADQDLGAPAVASGQLPLEVSTDQKRVVVDVTPDAATIEPGAKLRVELSTHAVDGEAIPAAVALFVVDEGVLSLMGYETPDPLSFFHRARSGEVGLYADHSLVLPREAAQQPVPSPVVPTPDELRAGDGDFEKVMEEASGAGSGYGGGAPAEAMKSERADRSRGPHMNKPSPAPGAATITSVALPPAPGQTQTGASRNGIDANLAMNQEVKLRTLFATTAYFESALETDAQGRASVEIEMPENLTSFRIMAVAIDPERADRFGSGEASVRVRKAIMLRPSLPRFLNLGDTFEASLMVDNQSEVPQTVMVGTRGVNVMLGDESETQTVIDIPPGGSQEVRFPMAVAEVGVMRLQFAALANEGRDATELDIPVQVPATREAFADYGMTSSSVQRQIQVPTDALSGFGGLEISMSSTALSGLEDAVEFLTSYPYECSEQTASRLLPIFALDEVLDDFPIATLADRGRRDLLAKAGIARLFERQNYDGGFGYWSSTTRRESWPYVSTWVTLALLEGKRAGHLVDQDKLDSALAYLENFARNGHATRWGQYYDWTSRAFALWLLSREQRGAASFDRIWAKRAELPLYARVMLMSAAHRYKREGPVAEVLAELRAQIVEGARVVHFAESRTEAAAAGLAVLMHSNTQTDALALMALLELDEETGDDGIASKVIAGLMSDRDPRAGGRWSTTHANAWALLAASRYYERMESETPDFEAQIWLDTLFAGKHAFVGRDMSKINQQIPMATLLQKSVGSLTLAKSGPGKLYYRLGLRYAPSDFKMDAVERGFTVSRSYAALPATGEAEADPAAVVREDDGSWTIKAGTKVEVTLSLVVPDRANFVVVDDPFPAGFEGQNPRFLTSGAAGGQTRVDYGYGPSYGRGGYGRGYGGHSWWNPWYSFDHSQMRDDRMLLFADQIYAGVYTYSYTARATSLGTFVLPPVRAEAMYEPERFGHGASSTVRIVE